MKLKYIGIGITAILIVSVTALLIFGESWAEKKLKDEIGKIKNLQYESVDINMADKQITLAGIEYHTNRSKIEVDSLSINGIDIYYVLFANTIKVKNLHLLGVKIDYTFPKVLQANKSMPMQLPKFRIEQLTISNSLINFYNEQGKTPFAHTSFDISIQDIDRQAVNNPVAILNKITQIDIKNTTFDTQDGLYQIGLSQLHYAKNKKLVADSIFVQCKQGKYELGHYIGHEVNWIKLSIDSMVLPSPDLKKLALERRTSVIQLFQPDLLVFLDKRLPFPESKRPNLLKEMLATSTYSFGIDSIRIQNANIAYEEYIKKADGPGRISFNQLDGVVENLYTYDQKSTNPPRLRANCNLLNSSKLYADISFPLSEKGNTIVKGKLEPMDLTLFNQMMKYVAFTEIEQGHLNSLDFNFTYNSKMSHGKMNFAYENLKIDFLNKENAKSGGFFNEIKGFVANTFVVNEHNNNKTNKFRVGDIQYERNIKKSMFNFWWKSILSGFRSSTGIKPADEKIDNN